MALGAIITPTMAAAMEMPPDGSPIESTVAVVGAVPVVAAAVSVIAYPVSVWIISWVSIAVVAHRDADPDANREARL
jgi:hypothetical protein